MRELPEWRGASALRNMGPVRVPLNARGAGVRTGFVIRGTAFIEVEGTPTDHDQLIDALGMHRQRTYAATRVEGTAAIARFCRLWNIPMVATAGALCEVLQTSAEDLSLVNALPLIVPVCLVVGAPAVTSDAWPDLRRTFPVLARCTDKVFIRSQPPIYTPTRLARELTLAVPNDWKPREK